MSHSRDGSSTRPSSRSGGRPTAANPRPSTSDAYSRRPFRSSLSPSPSLDKAVPSFLRPTVSSSLRSTSPSPTSRTSSSKGSPCPVQLPAAGRATRSSTPNRSPAQQPASSPKRSPAQPVSAPRLAMDKAKAKSGSTSRWSVASPRLLMQKASNAFIKAGKMRSKKNKDLAGPAASAVASVNTEASGAASCEIKTETERAPPAEMQQHRPPEIATVVPQEEVITTTEAPQEEMITTTVAPQEEAITTTTEAPQEEAITTTTEAPQEEAITTTEAPAPEEEVIATTEAPEEEVIATTEAPLSVQEVVIVEPNVAQNSTEIKTEEDSGQVEQVSTGEPTGDAEKAIEEHNVTPEESVEALKVDTPVPEEKPQIGEVDETEKEAEKKTEDELPPAAVVEESANEPEAPAPLNVQDEPATSTAKEEVVLEIKPDERVQEESPKHEEITENPENRVTPEEEVTENSENRVTPEEVTESSEKSVMPEEVTESSEKSVMPEKVTESSEKSVMPEEVTESSEKSVTISEEPKEQPATAEKQQEEVAEEPKMIAASRASSVPATSLEEALEKMEATTKRQASTSQSEPVSPAKEAASKNKAVIDTLLSASAPTTPAKGDARMGGPSPLLARIPEEMRHSFKGSRVKTALEKRPEEAQPRKKEVARSNDVLQEAKSKLLEKKKSKVSALVGAFETVMDSPRVSTPGAKSKPSLR